MGTFAEYLHEAQKRLAQQADTLNPHTHNVEAFLDSAFRMNVKPSSSRTFTLIEIPSCFRILGLPFPVSPKSVKQRFRQLAFETHPDRLQGDCRVFRTIRAAYEEALSIAMLYEACTIAIRDYHRARSFIKEDL